MDNYKDIINDEVVDIKEIVYKYLGKWYLFILALSISISVAYFINKWTNHIYEVQTSILIKDEQPALDSRFSIGPSIYENQYKIPNEISIIKSYQITQRALEHLNFTIGYYLPQQFNEIELYKSSPFQIILDTTVSQLVNVPFNLKLISADEFEIKMVSEKAAKYNFIKRKYTDPVNNVSLEGKFSFFQKIKTKDFAFMVVPNEDVQKEKFIGENIIFKIYTPESLVVKYINFTAYKNKNTSVISICAQGTNIQKSVDFVNAIATEYLKKGVEKKNQIAENTIKFIDDQIAEISDSLNFSESRLQNYRSEKKVMNMDYQVQQTMSSLETLKNQRAGILVEAKYYDYLKNYLLSDKNNQDLVAPSTLGINDPVLGNFISELTRLFNDKMEIEFNSKRDNPYLSSLTIKIKAIKNTILENIANHTKAMNISLQEVEDRIAQESEKVNKLPETQRQLFGFERKFKLNDALYTYLLTKRSEMQIAKVSYLPNNEIVDIARETNYIPISPNSRKNYMTAFFLGILIPLGFILVRDFLNDKIKLNKDIEKITDFPILGHIIRNKDKNKTVAYDNPMCVTSESIRSIRTNFQFITNEKNSNIVLITSSMMNEGKSFVCLNLALSFALNNKKCILLSFDLRKPKLSEYLKITNDVGITTYLTSNILIQQVITPTQYSNLDVILPGPIPPNPMELISNTKTKELFDQLKNKYDYIFVDTPPIGMVADALILLKYSDINIYIIRHNYTLKKMCSNIITTLNKRKILNFNVIINDVPIGKKYLAYSQGHAYNYGYGYDGGYYLNNDLDKKSKKPFKITKVFKEYFC